MTALLTGLGLSLALGGAIAFGYWASSRGGSYSSPFMHTCAVTVLLIGSLIGIVATAARDHGAVGAALAFALIGLLGLVRFRITVRDAREFSYLLLSIVAGVGVGCGQYAPAVLCCGAALAVLGLLEHLGLGTPRAPALRLRIRGRAGMAAAYEAALGAVAARISLVGLRQMPDGTAVFDYDLVADGGRGVPALVAQVQEVPGTAEVSAQLLGRRRAAGEKEDA